MKNEQHAAVLTAYLARLPVDAMRHLLAATQHARLATIYGDDCDEAIARSELSHTINQVVSGMSEVDREEIHQVIVGAVAS